MSERIDGGDIVIRVVVDSNKATQEVDNFSRATETKMKSAGNVIGTALKIFASAAVLNGIKNMALEIARVGEELNNASRRFGTSVENISRLQYAAQKLGVDFSTLATGMKFVARNAVEANEGNKDLQAAFDTLGVSVKDANGNFKDGHTLLLETLRKLDGVTNSTKQTQLAMTLLGRSGDELKGLAGAIREAGDESDRIGATWSTSAAQAADDFGDSVDRLKASFKGLIRDALEPALPAASSAMGAIGTAIDWWKDKLGKGLQGWGDLISGATARGVNWSKEDLAQYGKVIDATTEKAKGHGNAWDKAGAQGKTAVDKIRETLAQKENMMPDLSQYLTGGAGGVIDLTQTGAQIEYQEIAIKNEEALNAARETGVDILKRTAAALQLAKEAELAKAQAGLNGLASIAEGMGMIAKNNKALFVFNQGILLVQGIMDAYATWMRAGSQGGIYGFALGAAIFAKMMAFIAAMRSLKAPAEPKMEIPGAAEGGIAMKPQVVAVAEYGRPEVIAPLDKFEKMIRQDRRQLTVSVADRPAFLRALAFEIKAVMAEENI